MIFFKLFFFHFQFVFLQKPESFPAEYKKKFFDFFSTALRVSSNDDFIRKIKALSQVCTGGWMLDGIALGLLNGKIGKQMGSGNIEKSE